jgi:broad specificity phosphatase PhoE
MFSHLPPLIVYVRHPQCIHNLGYAGYDAALAKGISNKNSPLTPRGEKQAIFTAEYLREQFGSFDAVFASDFIRTHSIPEVAGYDYKVEPRIGERWHGDLHERGSAFFTEFPEERPKYHNDYYQYCAPGGESCPDVEVRIKSFLSAAELFTGAQSMLVSSHGISGLCFRKVLLEASFEDWWSWYREERLGNASVTVYELGDQDYEVSLYNHCPWLEELGHEDSIEA